MKRRIDRSPQAVRDLLDAYTHIGVRSAQAAIRFLRAAEQTFSLLATSPGVGRPYQSRQAVLRTMRVWPIHTFRNYLVFYAIEPERIVIVRVIHGARDLPALIDS